MSHLSLTIIYVLLVLTLEANLSIAFVFPSKIVIQSNNHLFAPTTSSTIRKSNSPGQARNFQLSSFISDGAMGQGLLSYLPNRGKDMPPDFLELIREATTKYSNPSFVPEGEDLGGISHIIEVIDFEYKVSSKCPISIRKLRYANVPNLTKLLSVCLFHQLPAPIVCELLRECSSGNDEENSQILNIDEKQAFQTCLKAMEKDGWKAISFPEGIRVQIRPGQVCSTWKDDLPPRKVTPDLVKSLLTKAHLAATPPPPISMKQSSLSSRVATTSSKKSKMKPRSVKIASSAPKVGLKPSSGTSVENPFFPRDRTTVLSKIQERIAASLSKVRSRTQRLTDKLNQAGKAGFLAYGFLNLAVYAGGTLLQWNRISVVGPSTIASQVQKLGKVLGTVYVGSQVTKLPRIALAVTLAPVGNRFLDWLQDKLGVGEGTAFGILTAALIGSFFAVVGSLILGSALLG